MAAKPQAGAEPPDPTLEDISIERPRLTPQGRASPDGEGEDATDPAGSGAKQGQGDKAEG